MENAHNFSSPEASAVEGHQEMEGKRKNMESPNDICMEDIRKEVANIRDRLGRPIDQGILETVVMFIANGLPTSSSCEGHIEDGRLKIPYVEISAPDEPAERFIGQKEIFEKVARKYNLIAQQVEVAENQTAYWEAMKECSQNEETVAYKTWDQKNHKLLEKTRIILEKFYQATDQDVAADPDVKIKIEEGVGGFRLHSGNNDRWVTGGDQKLAQEEQVLVEKLVKYRDEMKELTQFLRERTAEAWSEFVLTRLGLTWNQLKGKKILDVGAGLAEVEQAAKKRGIEVVSVDQSPGTYREQGEVIPHDVLYLEADAAKLPFEDNTFDLIISHAAPPIISGSKEEVKAVILEARRVLKPGGEFRFGIGNLSANIFDDRELWTKEEEEMLSVDDRIKRIRSKSLEFLQSIDANITESPSLPTYNVEITNLDDHYYVLKK